MRSHSRSQSWSRFARGVLAVVAVTLVAVPGVTRAWSDNTNSLNLSDATSSGGPTVTRPDGTTYQILSFTGSITLGSVTLTAPTVSTTRYALVKYDGTGVVQWASVILDGVGDAMGIAADASGNVYVGGQFSNATTIGSTALTTAGGSDCFAAKFNSSGVAQWASTTGGTGADWCHGVGVDGSGNVYVGGGYRSNFAVGASTLTNAGSNDLFVAKLNSSGVWQWGAGFGGVGDDNGGWRQGLATDSAGNSYLSGQIASSFVVNGVTYNTLGARDAVVAKVDTNGTWQWLATGGSVGSENVYGISIDDNNNSYITGIIRGASTFGAISVPFGGGTDGFVAKVSAAGSWQWVRQISSAGDESGYGIGASTSGGVYVSGWFGGATVDVDGTTLTRNSTNGDGFVARWTTAGSLQFARRFGGEMTDASYGVGVDSIGNGYVSGYVTGPASVNFGTGANITYRTGCASSCGGMFLWGLGASGGVPTVVTTTTTAPTTTTSPATTVVPTTSVSPATTAVSPTSVASSPTVAPASSVSPATTAAGSTGTTVASTAAGTAAVRSGTGSATGTVATVAPTTTTTNTASASPSTTAVKSTPKKRSVSLGAARATVGGREVSTSLRREADQIVLTVGDMVAKFGASGNNGSKVSLDADGNLRVMPGDTLELGLAGALADSSSDVWLFSDPLRLGALEVTSGGEARGSLTIPVAVDEGSHTLVIEMKNSLAQDVDIRLGMAVGKLDSGPSRMGLVILMISLAALLAITLPVALNRRKSERQV
jgi:hypothetical protein